MHIRWQTDKNKSGQVIRAIVVRSYRDAQTGQSKAEVVAYIGTLKDESPQAHSALWSRFERILAITQSLRESEKQHLRRHLRRRIPHRAFTTLKMQSLCGN